MKNIEELISEQHFDQSRNYETLLTRNYIAAYVNQLQQIKYPPLQLMVLPGLYHLDQQ